MTASKASSKRKRTTRHRGVDKTQSATSSRSLESTLREIFGLEHLRPEQRKVIDSVLQGHDTLAIMPTGSGKSLCYQLPALKLPGMTIVVSPLISLMKDQVEKLRTAGVGAVQFNSALNRNEEAEALQQIKTASREFIFTTPERLSDPDFINLLKANPIGLFVIDEVHCISQWGHDFRPAFLGLSAAIDALGDPPVLALTATATQPVVEDIKKQLNRPGMRVVNTGIFRANLHFRVLQVTSEEEKISETIRLARETKGSGIIYTATVKAAEQMHQTLRQAGEQADIYHGQLAARERKQSQDRFMEGASRIMVATNAFGMGIDKSDIRFVIHFQIPANLEAYYQESGRAGRDNEPAECTLLYYQQDKRIQQFFLARRYPDAEDVEAVHCALRMLGAAKSPVGVPDLVAAMPELPASRLQVALKLLLDGELLEQDSDLQYRLIDDRPDADEFAELGSVYRDKNDHARAAFERMVFYAQTGFCRWRVLLEYFDEHAGPEQCGTCDNCIWPPGQRIADTAAAAQGFAASNANASDGGDEKDPVHAFRQGAVVRVPKLGTGSVLSIAGDKITIAFPNGETKTFLSDFVTPA